MVVRRAGAARDYGMAFWTGIATPVGICDRRLSETEAMETAKARLDETAKDGYVFVRGAGGQNGKNDQSEFMDWRTGKRDSEFAEHEV